MAMPTEALRQVEKRSDRPRRWRDHNRKRPQAPTVAKLETEAEPSPRCELSDREVILAGEVLARVTNFVYTGKEFQFDMLNAFLSIFETAWAAKEFQNKIVTDEDFLLELIAASRSPGFSTPTDVEPTLQKYREDFALAIFAARRLATRGVPVLHPDLVTIPADSFAVMM